MQKLVLSLCLMVMIIQVDGQKKKDATDEDVKKAYLSIPKVDGNYEYMEVVTLDTSWKKDDLYKNAKLFFTDEFRSAKDVLQYDDRNEGKIVGKGVTKILGGQGVFLNYFTDTRYVNFTLEVFCKDGRYRYRIYNIYSDGITTASGGSSGTSTNTVNGQSVDAQYEMTKKGITKKMDRQLFVDMVHSIESIIADLKADMSKRVASNDF